MDCGLPSSCSSKSSLERSRTILPFLSRTVTGNVTTFTLTGIVVTGEAGLCAAGEEAAGGGLLEFWDWSTGARRSKQNNGGIRVRPMPTLDDTGVRLVTFHPHRRGSHRSGLQSIAGTIHQHDGLLRLSSW